MIHSFSSFLATGCQSAGCNSRIHLLCDEGAGSSGDGGVGGGIGKTSQQEAELTVWFEDEETKPAEGGNFCLSFFSLFEAGTHPTAAAAGFLLLN